MSFKMGSLLLIILLDYSNEVVNVEITLCRNDEGW